MFLPSNYTFVDFLIESYEKDLNAVNEGTECLSSMNSYVFDSIFHDTRQNVYQKGLTAEKATNKLRSLYWRDLYVKSNIDHIISSKRKDEINKSLDVTTNNNLPDFTHENVMGTLKEWYSSLYDLFVEKVDHCFRKLSNIHKTNKSFGFSKKLIYHNMTCNLGMLKWEGVELIHDLRSCIFTLLGFPVKTRNSTRALLDTVQTHGIWHEFDGGAFRIKIHLIGTAHIEVDPYIAIKLNECLAKLYPNAIPEKFRTVTKEIKEFKYHDNYIPDDVIYSLGEHFKKSRRNRDGIIDKFYAYDARAKEINSEIKDIFKQIGLHDENQKEYIFKYDVRPIISSIIRTGHMPNYKSYQFYPTPQSIVDHLEQAVKDNENYDSNTTLLEPSAGIGNIADAFKDAKISCIEICNLNKEILNVKNHNVISTDFLKTKPDKLYDFVVMNPPYSEGRLKLHVEHALKFINDTGKIYAVVPTGSLNKVTFPGYLTNVYKNFNSEFDNTQIQTSIIEIKKLPT